ncbi:MULTISPECIES: hypothetical protein [Rhizobium]|nr:MULTISPECIES: hypothetical protein [Rhizobium]AGB75284.1 hypothetical protein RTCIAT899_PC07480 [Rhizobium tropici CIAT 899]MBB4243942.1 hypothetical protein [Rhizobium tropici]MBB5594986.1 hypothetical protein [Rhizobium tropici]NEV12375.1 DUF1127 domain-containing protein [Rhizobium tropici]TGE94466.1 DUF1127 domain-containing protein [Rhizobium sp. SEMIA 4088]
MTHSQFIVAESLAATIDELYQKFGVWRTARALLFVAWKRRQIYEGVSGLSNYQLRDIGLPEREEGLDYRSLLALHVSRLK